MRRSVMAMLWAKRCPGIDQATQDWRLAAFSCKFPLPIQASILNRLADVGRRELGVAR